MNGFVPAACEGKRVHKNRDYLQTKQLIPIFIQYLTPDYCPHQSISSML